MYNYIILNIFWDNSHINIVKLGFMLIAFFNLCIVYTSCVNMPLVCMLKSYHYLS